METVVTYSVDEAKVLKKKEIVNGNKIDSCVAAVNGEKMEGENSVEVIEEKVGGMENGIEEKEDGNKSESVVILEETPAEVKQKKRNEVNTTVTLEDADSDDDDEEEKPLIFHKKIEEEIKNSNFKNCSEEEILIQSHKYSPVLRRSKRSAERSEKNISTVENDLESKKLENGDDDDDDDDGNDDGKGECLEKSLVNEEEVSLESESSYSSGDSRKRKTRSSERLKNSLNESGSGSSVLDYSYAASITKISGRRPLRSPSERPYTDISVSFETIMANSEKRQKRMSSPVVSAAKRFKNEDNSEASTSGFLSLISSPLNFFQKSDAHLSSSTPLRRDPSPAQSCSKAPNEEGKSNSWCNVM